MTKTTLKIAATSLVTLAFATGSAFAGDGKDCDHKKKAAMKTQTTTAAAAPQTDVLATSSAMKSKAKMTKTYTFEEALEKCQAKPAKDLQACIDYKIGKTKPAS